MRWLRWAAVLGVTLAVVSAGAGSYLAMSVNHAVGPPPAWLKAETVRIARPSGAEIGGWFMPGQPHMGGVLLVHGIHGDRRFMVDRARVLQRAGYSALLIDLQAHGETRGDHVKFGHLESKDVEAASRVLRERLPDRPLAVVGVSLGGAAVLLAPGPLPFDAAVLEAVYPTIESAVKARLVERLGTPGGWLAPLLLGQLRPRLGIDAADLRPIDHVAAFNRPLLLLSGEHDPHPTAAEAREMLDQAAPPKSLHLFPAAAHDDLFDVDPDRWQRQVLPFLARHLPGGERRSPVSDACPASAIDDVPDLVNVVRQLRGRTPVWMVDDGGPWNGADRPNKTLWVVASPIRRLTITGRSLDGDGHVRFMRNGGTPTDRVELDDVSAASVRPGGSTPEQGRRYAFVTSHVMYPAAGCWRFLIDADGRSLEIVRQLD